MTSSFINPWVEMILQQMWIVRQTTSMVARSIDTELLGDPQALTDYCLNPTEKRLNPLEFHGRRRAPQAQHSRSGNPERDAAPHAQNGQPPGLSATYADLDLQGRSRP
jgi:hypothetical protein